MGCNNLKNVYIFIFSQFWSNFHFFSKFKSVYIILEIIKKVADFPTIFTLAAPLKIYHLFSIEIENNTFFLPQTLNRIFGFRLKSKMFRLEKISTSNLFFGLPPSQGIRLRWSMNFNQKQHIRSKYGTLFHFGAIFMFEVIIKLFVTQKAATRKIR